MIPGVFMFETSFNNSIAPSLSIDGLNGITQISWGIWKACYSNLNNQTCTASHWIANPYTFTIFEGDNQANVTVNQSWLNSLFLHFIAILYAILIGIFHFVRYYYHNKILSFKKTNYLTLSLCGWMTIIIITDYAVLQSIKNAMQSLTPGGFSSLVNTNPESGFWLTVTAYLLIIVFLFITWCYPLQGRSQETRIPLTETRIPEARIPETKSIPPPRYKSRDNKDPGI